MRRKRMLSKYDGDKLGWFRWWKLLVGLIAAVLILVNFVIGVSRVDGHSMDTTLHGGQLVFYMRLGANPEVGDIVAIKMASGDRYIKRVIAVPGDVIDIQGDEVTVNGQVLNEDYISSATDVEGRTITYPYTVEEDRYFVMGDNREVSIDSRDFGSVLDKQILGIVIR